jgi:multidrug efflux system membrane fusion protein
MNTATIIRIFLFGHIMLLGMLTSACRKEEVTKAPEPQVTVAHPRAAEVSEHIDLTGTVGALQSVTNVARVSGYLESLDFQDGGYVKKGTPLFKIQQDEYIQNLNLYQAKLTYSTSEYNRQLEMLKKNATSENAVEQYLSEMDQNLANVALATLNLQYTTVSAPFDGLLGNHLIDVGNMVGENSAMPTAIVVIQQIDPIYVNFSINTRDALRLRRLMAAAGMGEKAGVASKSPVLAQLEDETGFPHAGILDFSNNSVETSTGTIQLRGIFPNPDKVMFPGLFAAVRIPLGAPKPGLVLPESAVLSDQEGDYVFVVNARDVVERRSVVKGPQQGNDRAVKEGVDKSDMVVINGIPNIRIGQKVRVMGQPAAATTSPSSPPAAR